MFSLKINGKKHEFEKKMTIFEALRSASIDVPHLCHDPRLKPIGACRLCVVQVKGQPRPITSCNTEIASGMEIETHTEEVESLRKTNLRLLANQYPREAYEEFPDKPFHHYIKQYGLENELFGSSRPQEVDRSHPYIQVDPSKCIYCYRCVRICDEVQGQFVWRIWNRGDRTRILPDSQSTLLESSCVSCGACVDTCPTGSLEDKTILESNIPEKWTRTTCPYCGVGCEMSVGTKAEKIVSIRPVQDAPVSKGHLCVKGRYAHAFTHSQDRITDPMIRDSNGWRKVSWEEAFKFSADRLLHIMSKHGPDSIGILGSSRATNEENYLTQKFARTIVGTNNVDCCARVCHAPTAAAMGAVLGTGAATNSFDDIEKAKTFLICGANPTENHPIVGARIKQAVLHGAQLVIIDPREIELTKYAAIHLQLRAGTNVALLNAIASVIVEEKLYDEVAIRERISEWDEYKDFIREWTPEKVQHICTVDPELIRKAARLFARNKPSMCVHGLGMTEHIQGTEGVMCLVNLALLTGNFGKPGAGVNPLRGQNNVQGSAHMGCEPSRLTGYVPLKDGVERFEKVWGTKITVNPGLNLMQMIDASASQQLKALWVIGYDIALTNPNATATKEALKKLEFVIVQDLFMNEIAREFGTVFFPACSSFEKDGTFMNSERRVQRIRKAMEPIGNSKPDWQIICQLAQAMDKGNLFPFQTVEEIWNEVRQVWTVGSGITYERLEHGGLQWPCPSEDHPGTQILHVESFPMGKKAALRQIPYHPTTEATSSEFPYLLTTGRTLYQFNAGTMTQRTANIVLCPTDILDISSEDALRYQLRDGDHVRLRSHYGEAVLPIRISTNVRDGELFATFHSTDVFLNQLIGPHRDTIVATPEYKVTAVRIEKP